MKPLPFLLTLALCAASASADVKLPLIFGDHMVLQQGKTLPVWGTATPGEKVTVTIGADSESATAAADGSWRVDLKPLPVSATGTTLAVTGKNTLTFQDVLVGDVWVASGQSNMELGMADLANSKNVVDMKQIIADSANRPLIRFFHVANAPAIAPKPDVAGGKWEVASPDAVNRITAVGYLFAITLQDKLHQPVGVIETCWGGQPIQTFMSRESLQALPFTTDGLKFIQPYVDAWTKLTPDQQTATVNDYQTKLADWQKNIDAPYIATIQKWQTDDAAAKAAGQPEPVRPAESVPRPISPNGWEGWYTTLYNGMINPLIPYAIKGALWYQGESNGGNSPESDQYFPLLKSMITDWRARWGEGDFPFLVVGIANFGYRFPDPVDEGWAHVREGEIKASEKVSNVAVAESIDIGEMHGIHPVDKMDVARRLAAAALHLGYDDGKVDWVGPAFAGITVGGDNIRIKFDHTADGLMIGVSPHVFEDNPALPTDHLVGFAIAGDDHKWAWADAKIDGNDVVLTSPQVPHPVAARYGWANDPGVNLYNKDGAAQGLPAEPFRTDDWSFVSPPQPPEKW